MDWAITITIVTLILSFITALGVWLGPKWVENSRRSYEARQNHLGNVKAGVIRPLLNQLEHYYIPVCTNKISNIIGQSVLVRIPDAPLSEWNEKWQDRLKIFAIDDIMGDWKQQDMMRDFDKAFPLVRDDLIVDRELYEDIRDNHESGLIQRWEAFVSNFAEYNQQCFKHVQSVARQLVERSGVPDWDGQGLKRGLKRGVNPAYLASYVLARQLGISSYSLSIAGGGDTFQMSTPKRIMAIGTEEEMKNLLTVGEKLVTETTAVAMLQDIKSQMKIEETVRSVQLELKSFELSNSLKGNCAYIKG